LLAEDLAAAALDSEVGHVLQSFFAQQSITRSRIVPSVLLSVVMEIKTGLAGQDIFRPFAASILSVSSRCLGVEFRMPIVLPVRIIGRMFECNTANDTRARRAKSLLPGTWAGRIAARCIVSGREPEGS
jgi:hypothetical protein